MGSNPILDMLAKELAVHSNNLQDDEKPKYFKGQLFDIQDDMDCYTDEDLRKLWKCSYWTIFRYRKFNGLPFWKPNEKRVLYPKQAVRKWFRAQQQGI